MNTAMLIIYGLALAIIAGAGLVVYRLFAARGRLWAGFYALSTSSALVLIWPIPIHGGFTILAEVFYDELQRYIERRHDADEIRAHEAFRQRLRDRFAGPLDYDVVGPLAGSWQSVSVAEGRLAWYDTSSQLIWSEPIELASADTWPSLTAAKSLCASYPPAGHWALPTEAEQYHFWQANGATALAHPGASELAYVVDEDLQTETLTISIGDRDNQSARIAPSPKSITIRCVARSRGAPARGYIKADIPLEQWNTFQLSKAAGGT